MTTDYQLARYIKLQRARQEIYLLSYDKKEYEDNMLNNIGFAMKEIIKTMELVKKIKAYKRNKLKQNSPN